VTKPDKPKVETYAVVDVDGLVINLVRWDGISEWQPPEGCVVVVPEDPCGVWDRVDVKTRKVVASMAVLHMADQADDDAG
jgi:hypothetical protein